MRFLFLVLAAIVFVRTSVIAYWVPDTAHVCHCDVGHGACGCEICVPKLADPSRAGPHDQPIMKTECGDPASGTEAARDVFVAPTSIAVVAPPALIDPIPLAERIFTDWTRSPDPRPPRTA